MIEILEENHLYNVIEKLYSFLETDLNNEDEIKELDKINNVLLSVIWDIVSI